MIKRLSLILLACSAGYFVAQAKDEDVEALLPEAAKEQLKEHIIARYYESFDRPLRAGNYLASRHAQIHHDWENANLYVQKLIENGIDGKEIKQRAMVLALGNGHAENAIKIAKQVKQKNPDDVNVIADILLITDHIQNGNFGEAKSHLKGTPKNGAVRFIEPFLIGWINAALGTLDIKNLQSNTVQLYHAILISGYLKDHSQIEKMIERALSVETITPEEIEKMADLYGHVGMIDKALPLYERILKVMPENENIQNKIKTLREEETSSMFVKISTPQDGVGRAFGDIAKILTREGNDETARVFAYLALYLAPDSTDIKFLLAEINAKYEQYDAALSLYMSVPEADEHYMEAQHEIATLYENTDRIDDALKLLNILADKNNDVDTVIKIGDLNRHQSNFGLALSAYDRAVKILGGTIPDEYWHLHYVRGICYEQADNWEKAEKELKAALEYRPDHPYILNYLGYSWADQGVHLDKALEMIQRASDLRPSDGYITDSLGWVMYRIQDYESAVNALERAVELLPYDPTVNDHLGDAYWKVGRKLEAKFQWERAKNHSEDTEQINALEQKLSEGLNE